MSRIGIVTGLQAEHALVLKAGRRLAESVRPLASCAAADPERAHEAAIRLAGEGARALLSFGIAGGLDPALPPGTVIVADRVILTKQPSTPSQLSPMQGGGIRYETSPDWRAAIAESVSSAVIAPVLGSDKAIANSEEKADLHRRTGAAAVDMESGGVAQAAARFGLPFMAVRIVADPAHSSLPASALAGLAPDGGTRPSRVLRKLVARPWELPALIRVALDGAAAMRSLRRVAARCDALLLGPPG